MSKYVVPKRLKYNTKVSKTQADEDSITDTIKRFIILATACVLAGIVALKLYLAILPPIANLSDFKPNMVTKFLSSDGEVIKTFNACTFSKVEANQIPKELLLRQRIKISIIIRDMICAGLLVQWSKTQSQDGLYRAEVLSLSSFQGCYFYLTSNHIQEK